MQLVPTTHSRVSSAVLLWLNEKVPNTTTASRHTYRAYYSYIASFRSFVQTFNVDLDAPAEQIAVLVEQWADLSEHGPIKPSTYNARLDTLRSFYEYCVRHGDLLGNGNPLRMVKRRPVQSYAYAEPLDFGAARRILAGMSRDSLIGKRDYAILLLGLSTGRRLNEIRMLDWGDIDWEKPQILFAHCKGGKVFRHKPMTGVFMALWDYRQAVSLALQTIDRPPTPKGPVFVSLSLNNSCWARLSEQSFNDIIAKHFDTGKFHTLRHTFARMMEESGAPVSEIQFHLGHDNLATTGKYLARLRSDQNEHNSDIAAILGVDE